MDHVFSRTLIRNAELSSARKNVDQILYRGIERSVEGSIVILYIPISIYLTFTHSGGEKERRRKRGKGRERKKEEVFKQS